MLLPPRSRGRPPKTERPQRFTQREQHPINHHVAGRGANPRSWTEISLGARAYPTNLNNLNPLGRLDKDRPAQISSSPTGPRDRSRIGRAAARRQAPSRSAAFTKQQPSREPGSVRQTRLRCAECGSDASRIGHNPRLPGGRQRGAPLGHQTCFRSGWAYQRQRRSAFLCRLSRSVAARRSSAPRRAIGAPTRARLDPASDAARTCG
jgi:hypothetical protein